MKKRVFTKYPIFDRKCLEKEFQELDINAKHIDSIYKLIIHKGFFPGGINYITFFNRLLALQIKATTNQLQFDRLTTLGIVEFTSEIGLTYGIPQKAIHLISEKFVVLTSEVIGKSHAKDGSTTKLLIELQDGNRIETCIMRYGDVALDSFPYCSNNSKDDSEAGSPFSDPNVLHADSPDAQLSVTDLIKDLTDKEKESEGVTEKSDKPRYKSNKRATVCVSSQVGCAMGCKFCATGTMNLLANLNAGEIVEQLIHANKEEKIRNVVFMGMGEPLDNYQAVLSAIRIFISPSFFSLSPNQVTVSTVGVVPRLISLTKDLPNIGLALSLHAPTQALRMEIVPSAKAWPLDRIIDAMRVFISNQNKAVRSKNRARHVLVEYVLIAGVNDSKETAHELGKLLESESVLLNVIPYNETDVPYDYKTPSPEVGVAFVEITRSYGIHTLFRQKMGDDISSACGQLVIENTVAKKQNGGCLGDLEDLGGKPENPSFAKPTKSCSSPNNLTKDAAPDEYNLKIISGKLNENLPGILIQYSILCICCYAAWRWAAAKI